MRGRYAVPVAVLAGLAAVAGVGAWLLAATPGALVNEAPPALGPTAAPGERTVVVPVQDGDSADEIGDRLEEAGAIESGRLFRVLVAFTGVGGALVAGDYEFERGTTAVVAVRRISQGITALRSLTIPEGLRAAEIGALLEERGVIAADEFRRALGDLYEADFREELPPGTELEGFLFPATYGFPSDIGGHDIVQQMLNAFDQRYRNEIAPLLAEAGGRSLLDVVILASIIEREAQVDDERPIIASVFLNRLAAGIPLQADPTVQFALAQDPASVEQFGYWKEELTAADLDVDSPYNTYNVVGLPPGPIANPGLDSILASLQPADTDVLFFVACPDGTHAFAETLPEHNQNVEQIAAGRCPE